MNWKSLFVKEDETSEETKESAAPAVTTKPAAAYVPSTATNYGSASSANPGVFEGQLRESIKGSGADYTRFKTACEELRSVLPDEATRLKSAFVSMKALGVTKEALVSAAKGCLSTMANEQAEFDAAMTSAYSEQVEGGVNKISSIDKQIEEKLAHISALQAEVDRMRSDKSKVSSEVEQSRSKIDTARRDFTAAYGKLVDEINSDINRISSNL